jgi:HTH-type transcriptional regulator/antitoxin HigA
VAVLKDLSSPTKLASLSDAEEDYLDVLGELVGRYEKHQFKQLAKPMTPLEALKYLVEQSGVSQSELARQCGARQSHISEFLACSRDLSKDNIVRIAKFFKVSPELFLKL